MDGRAEDLKLTNRETNPSDKYADGENQSSKKTTETHKEPVMILFFFLSCLCFCCFVCVCCLVCVFVVFISQTIPGWFKYYPVFRISSANYSPGPHLIITQLPSLGNHPVLYLSSLISALPVCYSGGSDVHLMTPAASCCLFKFKFKSFWLLKNPLRVHIMGPLTKHNESTRSKNMK